MRIRRSPRRERIDPDAGSSFRVGRFTPTHWDFAWHDHPEWELTLIERGSGLRYVGDSVEPFAAGDCCLLGPLLPHTWTSRHEPGRTVRSVVVQFPAVVVAGGGLVEAAPLAALADAAGRGLALGGDLAATTAAAMHRLAECSEPLERLAELWAILARIAAAPEADRRVLTSARYVLPRTGDPRLARVLALIDARAEGDLDLATVAASAGLGPEGFCRWFRRHTGLGFVAYRNAVRVSRAQRLLTETRDSITAIAFACGFGSLANFNRRFREVTGTTPRQVRRGGG